MDTRREFIKKAGVLAAAGAIPAAIQRALAIEPAEGSTFHDAEHVVILMQENRSFDHCFGALRGVRGFNDPRAVALPNGNPVWLQSNSAGETYAPFRLDLKGTNATWLGCLPHDWPDQSAARNGGRHDHWLEAKRSVLTLGYYTREDLPFYYALADAFTVCDQAFCSCLTGTNPNRLHLWSGTIRADAQSMACVRNQDAETPPGLTWTTFPERLEDAGITWRVYQNELYVLTGMDKEESSWLGNFGDNALEYFEKYGVRFAKGHRRNLTAQLAAEKERAKTLAAHPRPWDDAMQSEYKDALHWVEHYQGELRKWNDEKWKALPERQRQLHRQAFTTNEADPRYRELTEVSYKDGGQERQVKVPRGDVLHQFRADVAAGKLPAVSWLVAPQMFSDHPDSPWYGAWYIAEALDILTSRPEVWAKTVFILCYDENDGYFDHTPPFTPPDPQQPGSGKASPGMDTELEFIRAAQEQRLRATRPLAPVATGPLGLGYRVPLVIVSPWSRGGYVCSQVFDHTSILRFLEKWLTKKTGRPVQEPNISAWRRAVCGDLTSAFRTAGNGGARLTKLDRTEHITSIHGAKFKPQPGVPSPLNAGDIAQARRRLRDLPSMPRQEPGTRPSCALPYELSVNGALSGNRQSLDITFTARREKFGDRAAGAPFHVYAPGAHVAADSARMEPGRVWAFAVAAGTSVQESWPLANFAEKTYHLRVHGPNGFYREFRGDAGDPALAIELKTGETELIVVITSAESQRHLNIYLQAHLPCQEPQGFALAPGEVQRVKIPLQESGGWHDVEITAKDFASFSRHYAGRVETGRESTSDPQMG